MNRSRGIALLASLGLASCIDGSQRTAKCPTGPTDTVGALKACNGATRAADDGLIDDFEDGDNQLVKIGGRDGYWFTSHDEKGSTIGPNTLKMADGGSDG
ncbi:MAG: hypothetical protein M3O46_14150, partial [Myxococcota bacterium]|nr:hypothetical protein [Myxococcota bacterium]